MKEKDKYFYSNCFIEMVKAKLKNSKVKIMYLPAFLNEELEPYLYPERKNVWWYKWDKEQEKYLPITTDAIIEILNEMFGGKIVEIG